MTAALTTTATRRNIAAPTCAVRLIDRRTGAALRVNGAPLIVYSRNAEEAAADLLRDRDATIWQVRIEPIGGRP